MDKPNSKVPEFHKISENNLSYIAGFFDGEGSFGFHSYGARTKAPFLAIVNAHKEVLLWIQSMLGGKIYKRKKQKSNHSITYCLNWGKNRQILSVVEVLHPYLKVKKKRSKLIMLYLKSRLNRGLKVGKRMPLNDHEKSLQKKFILLNCKYNGKARGYQNGF